MQGSGDSIKAKEKIVMNRFPSALALCCVVGASLAWSADDMKADDNKGAKKDADAQWVFIDLQPKGNQKLKDDFHGTQFPGNNLASVPQGVQTFEEVKFKIGEQLIQLTSTQDAVADKPEKVEGLKVDAKLTKLHILHATAWQTDDDTLIGEYTVNWDDGSTLTIPIEYGKDVLDWWCNADSPEPTRGKVAWKGDNEGAKTRNATIRLYLTTWENSKPELKIKSIDYSTTKQSPAAPFCVAITGEKK
jgi:hypothetical protein